jgi:hypothetical protein
LARLFRSFAETRGSGRPNVEAGEVNRYEDEFDFSRYETKLDLCVKVCGYVLLCGLAVMFVVAMLSGSPYSD